MTTVERATNRLQAQFAVMEALAEAAGVEDVMPRLLDTIGTSLECDLGAAWLVDELAQRLRYVVGWSRSGVDAAAFEAASREQAFGPGEGIPGLTWELERPVWAQDVRKVAAFQRLEMAIALDLHGAIAFPIIGAGGRTLGALEFFAVNISEPAPDTLALLATFGRQIGQFVERVQILERARTSEVLKAAVVDGALDCVITIDGDGRILEFNPAAEATFGHRREDVLGQEMAGLLIPENMRAGHRAGLQRQVAGEPSRILNQRLELTAQRAGGELFPIELTALRLPGEGPPVFAAFLRDITARATAERERAELALTLQQALLPPHLPEIEGLELAAWFQPGSEGLLIGGDFYDALPSGHGQCQLIIGDVVGKGAVAATIASQARHTLRAAALTIESPAEVLRTLNASLLRDAERVLPMCSVAMAWVNLLSHGGPMATVASGGHPLPMVVNRDGTVRTVGTPGTILGVGSKATVEPVSVPLQAGDLLVLYTDGVTEVETPDGRLGPERLAEVLAGAAGGSAQDVVDRVSAVVAPEGRRSTDDAALLVARVVG